jgi:hypothetical protein
LGKADKFDLSPFTIQLSGTFFTVEYTKDDGIKFYFRSLQEFATPSDVVGPATVIGPDGKPVQKKIPPIKSLAQALARRNVAEAVQLFLDRGEDWTQLCNVLQMVRDDLRTEIPWVSHTKLKRLKRTAQFRETAGDSARHVKAKGQPPRNPMLLPEAQKIVREILIHWLQTP